MKLYLKNKAGVDLCEVDEYNTSIIRREAGREVSKLLLRVNPCISTLTITDNTGLTVATITVDLKRSLA